MFPSGASTIGRAPDTQASNIGKNILVGLSGEVNKDTWTVVIKPKGNESYESKETKKKRDKLKRGVHSKLVLKIYKACHKFHLNIFT